MAKYELKWYQSEALDPSHGELSTFSEYECCSSSFAAGPEKVERTTTLRMRMQIQIDLRADKIKFSIGCTVEEAATIMHAVSILTVSGGRVTASVKVRPNPLHAAPIKRRPLAPEYECATGRSPSWLAAHTLITSLYFILCFTLYLPRDVFQPPLHARFP